MRNAIVKALEMISSQTANCITFRDAENLFVDESEPFMEFQVKSSPICRAEATVGRRHRINYVQLEDSCVSHW